MKSRKRPAVVVQPKTDPEPEPEPAAKRVQVVPSHAGEDLRALGLAHD